jgi:hypothetical protein
MRKVLPLALLLGLASCATASHWEKPGANEETLRADMIECRRAASQEAFRQQAFDTGFTRLGAPWWGYASRPSYAMWNSRLASDRTYTEQRLVRFCMQIKGYELVPNQPPPAG